MKLVVFHHVTVNWGIEREWTCNVSIYLSLLISPAVAVFFKLTFTVNWDYFNSVWLLKMTFCSAQFSDLKICTVMTRRIALSTSIRRFGSSESIERPGTLVVVCTPSLAVPWTTSRRKLITFHHFPGLMVSYSPPTHNTTLGQRNVRKRLFLCHFLTRTMILACHCILIFLWWSSLSNWTVRSRSLLPATSRHAHSWHRAPLGPMAIYLFNVRIYVFRFLLILLIDKGGVRLFFISIDWCSLTTPYSTWGHIFFLPVIE
jgi:hypothetical protein